MSHTCSQVQRSAILTDDDYHTIITNNLQTENFKLLQTKVKPLSENLVGFMSTQLKIEATIHSGNPAKETKLHYFAKAKPVVQGTHLDLVNNTNLFIKESQFFSLLYPKLKRQYEEAHRFDDKQCFCVCSCYLVRDDLIVLEDLSYKGFKLHENRDVLDYDHCAAVLHSLASLHAASLSLEEKLPKTSSDRPQKINELYPKLFREALWSQEENHSGPIFLKSSSNTMLSLAEYLPNYGRQSSFFDSIQERLPETLNKICQYVKPSKHFRNVVCHGDLWKNNIMFRYENDKPVEVRCVDYQVIRYCPPAHDIITFLYLTTTRKFRELHLISLLKFYYKSLSEELSSYGLEAEAVLPWTEFLESCQDSISLGIISACLYNQVTALKPGIVDDVLSDSEKTNKFYFEDKSDILVPEYKSDPIFRERYSEIFEEFIEKCILAN